MSSSRHPFLLVDDSDSVNASVGGVVKRFKAAVALLVGDGVFLSAADTVSKTTSPTTRLTVGIVVGGSSIKGERHWTQSRKADNGISAAAANGYVYVLMFGIGYGVSDGAITIHQQVQLGTATAGRLAANATSDATVVVGTILGIALEAATGAGENIKILVKPY